jgi:hypothetical protein
LNEEVHRRDAENAEKRNAFLATDGAQINTDGNFKSEISDLHFICVHLCPICGLFLLSPVFSASSASLR